MTTSLWDLVTDALDEEIPATHPVIERLVGALAARDRALEAERASWEESSVNWQTLYQQEHDRADAMRPEALAEVAAVIRRRIRTHGVGLPHGCDAGRSNYCEAWRLILADVEALASTLKPPNDTTEENSCSTRP